MPFLPPNQQRQSTEGKTAQNKHKKTKARFSRLYDIQPGNEVTEKISTEEPKKKGQVEKHTI